MRNCAVCAAYSSTKSSRLTRLAFARLSQKYLKLERKINSVLFRPSSPTSPNLVKYWGCINKNKNTEGIVFDCVKSELTLSTTSRPLLQKTLQTSTWPRTLDKIFSQLLSCLLPLHDEGIVHRDVKPENVMVDVGGNLRIIDLGDYTISFIEQPSPQLTRRYAPLLASLVRLSSSMFQPKKILQSLQILQNRPRR